MDDVGDYQIDFLKEPVSAAAITEFFREKGQELHVAWNVAKKLAFVKASHKKIHSLCIMSRRVHHELR